MKELFRAGQLREQVRDSLRQGAVQVLGASGDAVRRKRVETAADSTIDILEKGARRLFFRADSALTAERVEAKYDELAGSYLQRDYGAKVKTVVCWMDGKLQRKPHAEFNSAMIDEKAAVLSEVGFETLLEVGAGELNTLAAIAARIDESRVYHGIDLSFSRVYQGAHFFRERGLSLIAAKANALQLPYGDESFDVVFSSHCLEHIPGDFQKAIDEMIRVARKAVILFEPSYELTGPVQRLRMRAHGYVRGIPAYLSSLHRVEVREPWLLENSHAFNRTACHIIELKPRGSRVKSKSASTQHFACPGCQGRLSRGSATFRCHDCEIAFPVIDGVAVIDLNHAYSIRLPRVEPQESLASRLK